MTPRKDSSEDEKTTQTLEEICENTRAIRRVVNRIFDHLHETKDRHDYEPNGLSWEDLYNNDDMYC